MRVVIRFSDAIPVVISSVDSDIAPVRIPSISVALHAEHVDTMCMLSVMVDMLVPSVVEFGSISTTALCLTGPAALRSLCKSKIQPSTGAFSVSFPFLAELSF